MRYASGDNFTIDVEDGVAIARVFRRPELDQPALARCSTQLLAHARALTVKNGVSGMVVDLRRVPGAVAPTIVSSYGEMVGAWEHTGQRIALLVLPDAVQMMQLGRAVAENGARFGALLTDRNEARSFAGATAVSQPGSVSRVLDAPSRIKRMP